MSHDMEIATLNTFANAEGLNPTQRALIRQAAERLEWCDEQLFKAVEKHLADAKTIRGLNDALETCRANFKHETKQLRARDEEIAGLMSAVDELRNLVSAKRYDRSVFDDDTTFADWALSRCRFTLSKIDAALQEKSRDAG